MCRRCCLLTSMFTSVLFLVDVTAESTAHNLRRKYGQHVDNIFVVLFIVTWWKLLLGSPGLLLLSSCPSQVQLFFLLDFLRQSLDLVLVSLVNDARCLFFAKLLIKLLLQLFFQDSIFTSLRIIVSLMPLCLFDCLILFVLTNLYSSLGIVKFVFLVLVESLCHIIKLTKLLVKSIHVIAVDFLLQFDLLLEILLIVS